MPADSEFDGVREDLDGIEDGELRGLIERAHMIDQLSQHPGWSLLVDYLTAYSTATQRAVLGGSCQSMEQYREQTGFVKGLQAAMDAPKKLGAAVQRKQEQAAQARSTSDE